MPAELGPLQVAGLIDKLGTIGVLIAVIVWLVWDRLRLVKQSVKTFRQRDMARLISERYRGGLVAAQVAVPDISDILKEYAADADPA